MTLELALTEMERALQALRLEVPHQVHDDVMRRWVSLREAMEPPRFGNFVDDRHALFAGWMLGTLRDLNVPVEPLFDEWGDYTDRVRIPRPPGSLPLVLVIPPPPGDWELS